MPIKDKAAYGPDWQAIRKQVQERAGNKCEGCGVANHAVGARDKRGDWHNQDEIDHMNSDHADAIALYAEKLLGLAGKGWRMTAIDCDGADLVRDEESAFLPFDAPVTDADSLRKAFAALSARARAL